MSQFDNLPDWQPTAPLAHLRERAKLNQTIRDFFSKRNVMEVTTPVLCRAGVTDVYLDNFTTRFDHEPSGKPTTLYLQTSPEYAMKRLLASGSGCIYQIAPAFRHEGAGRLHNPEFTLLEWYRVGFSMQQLIDEVTELLVSCLRVENVEQYAYQQAFIDVTDIDPLTASKQKLYSYCSEHGIALYAKLDELSKDNLLQLIFTTQIEPKIGQHVPCVITHFPASQAALAKISSEDGRVADRFEVYFKGVELANGFNELTDVSEQNSRFEQDNKLRSELGLQKKPIDRRLLAAMNHGIPDCAGVAVGLDRLLMLSLCAKDIKQVLAFSIHQA